MKSRGPPIQQKGLAKGLGYGLSYYDMYIHAPHGECQRMRVGVMSKTSESGISASDFQSHVVGALVTGTGTEPRAVRECCVQDTMILL